MNEPVKLRRTSYSAINLYGRCPSAWMYQYIDKLPNKVGKAAERGTRIHLAAERYLKGEIALLDLPVEYRAFHKQLAEAKGLGATPEKAFLVDDRWGPLTPDAEDNHPDAWIKAFIDMIYLKDGECHIVDFKTGKFYGNHSAQIEFYMLLAACYFPDIKVFHGCAWYLDEGSVGHAVTHKRSWLDMMRPTWTTQIMRIEKSERQKVFLPTPGPNSCTICSYGKSKGGPCTEEWVRGSR